MVLFLIGEVNLCRRHCSCQVFTKGWIFGNQAAQVCLLVICREIKGARFEKVDNLISENLSKDCQKETCKQSQCLV